MALPIFPVLRAMQSAPPEPFRPIDLLINSAPLTLAVLGVLAILSLLSWAIMLAVWRQMGAATAAATEFVRQFERSTRLEEAAGLARTAKPNALSRILIRAMHFVADTTSINVQLAGRERQSGASTAPAAATLTGSQIETLHLILDAEASVERDRLGRLIPWLATIASASPLIGLLGTVLGIIRSFMEISSGGSGNLAAVAPGVGEALTATAMALAVAIPATFGYNIFANRLNRFEDVMENFGTSVIARLVREGHI